MKHHSCKQHSCLSNATSVGLCLSWVKPFLLFPSKNLWTHSGQVPHLFIYSFLTARNCKLLHLKQKPNQPKTCLPPTMFLIYFNISFNQINHKKAVVVSHGKAENSPTVVGQEKSLCGKLECRYRKKKRSVVGETDDRRCDGLNWENKDGGEQKCNRKSKRKKLREDIFIIKFMGDTGLFEEPNPLLKVEEKNRWGERVSQWVQIRAC